MSKTILHRLFTACLIFAPRIYAINYGVGFSLSLDYGVASIYFPNGSVADVAKIEGGPAYKQMIRATDVVNSPAAPTLFHDAVEAETRPAQTFLDLQSLRNYLPPWLGGNTAGPLPLSLMLGALKTATESYLESSLSAAEVVMPFPVSRSFYDDLRSACSSLSLYMPLSAQPPAGILAARAYGIGGECKSATAGKVLEQGQGDDQTQLILTVDFNRAALTALLVAEECGVFEYRRVLHDTSLGGDSLFKGSDSFGSDRRRSDLVRALRDLTHLPLHQGNGAGLERISELVLLGESASDRRLLEVLKEALAEQSDSLLTTASNELSMTVDPLFAASRGVAQDCWDRMDPRYDKENHDAL